MRGVQGATPASIHRSQRGLRAVVAGRGCVEERLAAELSAVGARRPLLVCGEQISRSPVFEAVTQALDTPPAIFAGSRPHTPAETIDAGADAARAAQADAILAVGGSSAVDCAKGIAVLIASGRRRLSELQPISFDRLFEEKGAGGARVPLFAVTTTLSFAEFLPFWGVRHVEELRKHPYSDLELVDRTVFLDGELARYTPDEVWLQTGIKALDDALAAWCRASAPEPFVDPVLRDAIAGLFELLPRSAGRDSGEVRQQVLTAVWMTKFPLPRLAPPALSGWFSTTARHALGAVFGIPHGAASCIALPHALAFHAEETRERQAALASHLGWQGEGPAPLAAGLDALLERLQAPRRLRAYGIDAGGLDELISAMRAEAPALGGQHELRECCEDML